MTPIQAPQRPSKRTTEFAELARSVERAGLLDRRRGYYIVRIAVNLLVLAGGGAVFLLVGDSWWRPVTAAFLAVVFTRYRRQPVRAAALLWARAAPPARARRTHPRGGIAANPV
ncbi:hypothetical protein H0B56_15905 [Haloechinothrix sp. YIM 98757]|uniref:Uncharacterized protein n=1 Tax=Haloechinothrix aidingensis TaxID=2752311 RepID=A0A838ACX3_9PSEU|nr:hypothetical protein [Haloechinothrix aidingensis]MBA0127035.1 hypothetical protein [Haloechinothrix aidingensis]